MYTVEIMLIIDLDALLDSLLVRIVGKGDTSVKFVSVNVLLLKTLPQNFPLRLRIIVLPLVPFMILQKMVYLKLLKKYLLMVLL